jgi:hypothetical protein
MRETDSAKRDFLWYPMKLTLIVLFALIYVSSIPVRADIQSIKPNSKEEKVAFIAEKIFSVTDLKLGEDAYTIVEMDSKLNGDTNETTILLVGQGGMAGYDATFLLTPVGDARALKSARIENGEIALTFYNVNGGTTIKKFVHYDATSRTLKERLGK